MVVAASICACAVPPPRIAFGPVDSPVDSIETEQYAVLTALISAKYVKEGIKIIVIRDRTIPLRPEMVAEFGQRLPEAPAELLSDLEARNRESHPLKLLFGLPLRYVLEPPPSMSAWTGEDRNWNMVYPPHNVLRRPGFERGPRTYEGSQGTITVSMPGFVSDLNESMVYIENDKSGLDAEGLIVLLVRQQGVWTIKNESLLWVS